MIPVEQLILSTPASLQLGINCTVYYKGNKVASIFNLNNEYGMPQIMIFDYFH